MARGRNYDNQVKEEAVSLVVHQNKGIAEVSRQLEIPKSTIGKWVEIYKRNGSEGFVGSGNVSPDQQADRELQKRIRDLEEENKILKKAMRIFTNDQK